MSLPALYEDKQLALIRNTVAKDCNPQEFDTFIHMCRGVRLDPLRRQIYAFIFHKDDPKRRQMTIVTSIAGYRAIADRTGCYRPGKAETILDPSLIDPATNPRGISHATVTVYKHSHGEWHEVTETAHWEEYAPLKEIWENSAPTGRFVLDPKKDGWRRMPRVMLEKCAEAKALRRAWPDDFAGLMEETELDQRLVDITPSAAADEAAASAKLALVGGKDAITVDWLTAGGLERVPLAKFADAVLAYGTRVEITGMEFKAFWQRNLPARTEFKAKAGHDYLELQRAVEALIDKKERAEVSQEAAE